MANQSSLRMKGICRRSLLKGVPTIAGAASIGGVGTTSTGSVREILTADRTYYVRAEGNDSNNGLTNTAAGAFRTIQHAIDVAAIFDFGITRNLRIQIFVADGTYTEDLTLPQIVGGNMGDLNNFSSIEVIGNVNMPSNVVLRGGMDCCGSNYWLFAGMRVVSNIGAFVTEGAIFRTYDVEYGCNKAILLYDQSQYYTISNLTFIGSHDTCIEMKHGSFFLNHSAGTINTSGGGSYTTAFLTMTENSKFESVGTISNSGGATGSRYVCDSGSVISTVDRSLATLLPGNTAGTIIGGGTVNGYSAWSSSAGTIRTNSTTVANLPSAATVGAGARAFVTDALTTNFGSSAVGGGANARPVWSDGSNWYIG